MRKLKLTLPDKIVIACVVVIVMLTAYAYIFFSQVLMYISFALILSATLFYSIWHIWEYIKKKDDGKTHKVLFIKMVISSAVCLIAIVLSVLCYTGIWFVVT